MCTAVSWTVNPYRTVTRNCKMCGSRKECKHCWNSKQRDKNWDTWSRYRPGVAQRVGIGIDLLFHDRGTRRGWVVSSTPRPHFTPGKDPVPILQDVEWAPGPVWTGGKSRPHRDLIPDRPAHVSYIYIPVYIYIYIYIYDITLRYTIHYYIIFY